MEILQSLINFLPVFCRSLCKCNELTGFLHVWVFAANRDSTSNVWSSILYACLEPVLTCLFLQWPILSRIQLMTLSPLHVWLISLTIEAHKRSFGRGQDVSNTITAPINTEARDIEKSNFESNSATSQKPVSKPPSEKESALVLLPALVSAAIMHACLILFTQSFQAPSLHDNFHLMDCITIFTVILFLACRYADILLCKALKRLGSLRDLYSFGIDSPLFCIPLMLTIRACVRLAFGLPPFMGLYTPDTNEAEAMFGLDRFNLPEDDSTSRLFILAGPWFNLLGLGLMLLGRQYFISAFEEQVDMVSNQKHEIFSEID